MPKQIIFCADGTWNGDSEDVEPITNPTNVLKLFRSLSVDDTGAQNLSDEQDWVYSDPTGATLQIAKYLHGVGDSKNEVVQVLGGTLGVGLINRIISGYVFISRHYMAGDNIHLVGFSRGAYTVRALADLISEKGLLVASQLADDDTANSLGLAVWTEYRKSALKNSDSLLGKIEELVSMFPQLLQNSKIAAQLVKPEKITTVAVWDTVGSLGIPELDSHGNYVEALQFVNNSLSDCVEKGFHAISLDERRTNFPMCAWNSDPKRVVQVLFPGAHSDVGGGYPEAASGLANLSLQWMGARLAEQGVLFSTLPVEISGLIPAAASHAPWESSHWKFIGKNNPRAGDNNQMPPGLLIHRTLRERLSDSYKPLNLRNYLDTDGISISDQHIYGLSATMTA